MALNLKLSRLPRNFHIFVPMGRIDTVAGRVMQRVGPALYHGAASRRAASVPLVQSAGSASSSLSSSSSSSASSPRAGLSSVHGISVTQAHENARASLQKNIKKASIRRERSKSSIQGPSIRSSHSLPVLRRSTRLARASQNAAQLQRSMTPLSQYNDPGPPGHDDMELEPAMPASQTESLADHSSQGSEASYHTAPSTPEPVVPADAMNEDGATPGETMEADVVPMEVVDSSMRVHPHGYLVYVSNLGYPITEDLLRNYLSSRCGDVTGVEFRILGGSAELSPFTKLPHAQMIAVVRFVRFASAEMAMRIPSPNLCGYMLSISPSPYINPTTRESQERAANEGTVAGNVLRLSSNVRHEDTFQS
ncbi:hypothetical protein BDZ89DRAFT_1055745 [Hymenopellis radicata]|nr:hypothetical protein BDZ89DRAFT_1055745 [Hymenopellis radicata]